MIDAAAGKAVKVVFLQLGALPKGRRYRRIWMNRKIEEFVSSQEQRLKAENPDRELPSLDQRIRRQRHHSDQCLNDFRALAMYLDSSVELLEFNYRDCFENFERISESLQKFLKEKLLYPK